MLQVRRRIQYSRFSGCFSCGMPQTICAGWEPGGRCQYRGVLIPMVAMMLHGPWGVGIRGAWQRRLVGLQVDGADIGAVIGWLGQRSRAGHSQLFEEFCWLRRVSQEVELGLESGGREMEDWPVP